jgi:hypothetical protein
MEPIPFVALDPQGKATILSYNVPEPTSYYAKNLIELKYPSSAFKPELLVPPVAIPTPNPPQARGTSSSNESSRAAETIDRTFTSGKTVSGAMMKFGGAGLLRGLPDANLKPLKEKTTSLVGMMSDNQKLLLRPSMSGKVVPQIIELPKEPQPALYLVETHRISTYLGSYGAGRTIKTFSLLPGEQTKISVKTYTKSVETSKEASSILDSFTEEAADEFESDIQNENSTSESRDTSFEYYADVEAHASGKIGLVKVSADVSAGVSGSVNTAREEQTKNVLNMVNKHSAKASSKREININTSYDSTKEAGEETATERNISNINVSRTLNFVFRQMNQEVYTIVHLVDVRLAFFNGFNESKIEVPLYRVDELLDAVFANDTKKAEAKADIQYALQNIRDFQGNTVGDFFEVKSYAERGGSKSEFWRVNTDKTSTFASVASGAQFVVPGVILGVTTNVMRTEGVIVESILGQGEALDSYNKGLQVEKIKAQQAATAVAELQNRKEEAALKIVADKDSAAAAVYATVYPEECCATKEK